MGLTLMDHKIYYWSMIGLTSKPISVCTYALLRYEVLVQVLYEMHGPIIFYVHHEMDM